MLRPRVRKAMHDVRCQRHAGVPVACRDVEVSQRAWGIDGTRPGKCECSIPLHLEGALAHEEHIAELRAGCRALDALHQAPKPARALRMAVTWARGGRGAPRHAGTLFSI